MIVDSHTHVYAEWPFGPVADPRTRGSAQRLLATLDASGVDKALVIGAIFKGGDSNAATIAAEHAHPKRLLAFPQLDSMGTATHHSAGAAARLQALHEGHGGIRGFTHYCRDGNWFVTIDGEQLLAKAAELRHVVSIAIFAPGLPTLARAARKFPSLTFLVHHMGRLQEKNQSTPDSSALREAAGAPNLWFKISGFHHLSPEPNAFPYLRLQPLVRALYDAVGPSRLVWGSDAPVVESVMTHRQSLDLFWEQTPYISASEKAEILGGNLNRLLNWN